MKAFIAAIVAVSIFGCAEPRPRLNINDPTAVSSAIKVKRDDFKKQTEYIGPNAASDTLSDGLYLRAWKFDGSEKSEFQIYVMDHYYKEWRFYDSAYDSKGTKLDAMVISRKVDSCSQYSCSHIEHIGINVTRDYLENNQDTGINLKISGKAGEEIFYLPAGYIKAFLATAK